MKSLLIVLAMFACPLVQAQQDESKTGLNAPSLTAEELEKVLFSSRDANSVTPFVEFRIYNGLKDKWITGVVIKVSSTISEKEKLETDIYVSTEIAPLSTGDGMVAYFVPYEAKPEMKFTLKEVKYGPDPNGKPKTEAQEG